MPSPLQTAFATDGYVRIERAVPLDLADSLRRRMAEAALTHAPRPTIKLGDDPQAAALLTSAPLQAAFDALLGPGAWIAPTALEDLRVKNPAPPQPPWWHIDVFERGPQTTDEDLLSWRASPRCGGVGLLVLLLLSDVTDTDAPTALRAGSHHAVARHLAATGDDGLALGDLLARGIAADTADAAVALTTGPAGAAYLCHPMLVHAALANTGDGPSYWALPAVRVAEGEV